MRSCGKASRSGGAGIYVGILGFLLVLVLVSLWTAGGRNGDGNIFSAKTAILKDSFGLLSANIQKEPLFEADLKKRENFSAASSQVSIKELAKSAPKPKTDLLAQTKAVLEPVTEKNIVPPETACEFLPPGSPNRKIVINEIAWMGTSLSSADEWIELKNNSSAEVSLSGWLLRNEDDSIHINFPAEKISAGGIFVLERTDDSSAADAAALRIYSGALNNSGDWLKLFSAECSLVDEVNALAGWLSGDNSKKQTMERTALGLWQTSATSGGTPGKENSSGAVNGETNLSATTSSQPEVQNETSPPQAAANIIINEIFYDAEGSDEGKEFVELKNLSSSEADLKGWTLVYGSNSLTIGSKTGENTKINGDGYFLIGLNGNRTADIYRSSTLPNTSAEIVLSHPSGKTDNVTYGGVAAGQSYERQADGSFAAAAPSPQGSSF